MITSAQHRARDRRIKRFFAPPSVVSASAIVVGYILSIPALLIAADVAGHVAITVAVAVLIGTLLKGLNNIVHECSHQAFSNDRAFNERLGTILCVLLLTDYASYKKEHSSHHRFLGDYERDLDFQLRQPLGHDRPFTWRCLVGPLATLRFLWFYLPRPQLTRRDHVVGAVALVLLLGGLLSIGAIQAAAALALAHAVILPFLRFVIDIVDHGGIYRAELDELHRSRNFIVSNPVLRWMLFPRNDCYHLIHHLYPYLPVARFSEVHAILMEDPDYRALQHLAMPRLASR